ncbi:hypothetical protein BCS71_25690 [Vibrio lentus]|uniref:Uncharacterized protein n=1 Tax=Vibrio tasmaniensis TaxID=212663 RepID=A0A0H3ZTX5_9VIBR|nr:hypothetical protein [Vibrio lentus]AKN39725.1 hypothetical protein [Vibrio tasmaniensis]PMI58294.1 hypothetical protein BCU41_03940 [Vibrio lentus]
MALTNTLNQRLANYLAMEAKILTEFQSCEDPDFEARIAYPNLKQIQSSIESLQVQIKQLEKPKPRRRQYGVRL